MEHLTKQQITLLCLLVALFTSIATSVITASLLDQNSTGVTQTFYKVVEKTIAEVTQKDTPSPKTFPTKKAEPAKEPNAESEKQIPLETVVASTDKSIVTISQKDRRGNIVFISKGIIIGDKNLILVFDGNTIYDGGLYQVRFSDNTEVEMKKSQITFLGMAILTYPEKAVNPTNLTGLKVGNLSTQNLGSNVIAIGQKEGNSVVSTGIITEFPKGQDKSEVVTDVKLFSPLSGWILLNTSGQIIGLISQAQEGDRGARYIDIKNLVSNAPTFF